MKAQVNLGQILQGGLAALVGWLFKTVNDLQQEVATLKAQVIAYQDSINGFNQNLIIIEEVSLPKYSSIGFLLTVKTPLPLVMYTRAIDVILFPVA